MYWKTGQPEDALEAYKQALKIFERLARENPTVDEYQESLAVSHNNLGALYSETVQVVLTATTNTLLQSMVKDEYRGRVMSAYSLSFLGLMPLGTLMAGIVAEGWGATAWLAESGIVCAALTLIALRSAPALRSLA